MGPLHRLRILELAALGPVPHCAMVLSDLGARVIRIDRLQPAERGVLDGDFRFELLNRGRPSVAVDLKHPLGVAAVLRMVAASDALLEGFRPGVAERLGLGPDVCLERNPRLVYGRMTGWGQSGPLAATVGHDLNYIALTGALHAIGRAGGPPVPPLNVVGDFGGGSMWLAVGVLSALLEAQASGRGQVVDAAIVDGVASTMTMIHGLRAAGAWEDERGRNLLDSGAPFYDVYETRDGRWVSIAAIEPRFYAELLRVTGIADANLPAQDDRRGWPELRQRLAAAFRTRTRDEWCTLLEGCEICFAPVLTLAEAPEHPHLQSRETFVSVAGIRQPAPAPRFSRTPARIQGPPARAGADTDQILAEMGFAAAEIAELRDLGAVGGPATTS